jgi:DNA polymerase III alpha subunit (gram-positive type)
MKVIFYDLETTGFSNPQIASIGAFCVGKKRRKKIRSKHHVYMSMVPTCDFDPRASEINGMTKCGGILYMKGNPVQNAMSMKSGLEQFRTYLKKTIGSEKPKHDKIVLVAHNNTPYDSVVLRQNWDLFQVQWPGRNLYIVDSMDLMRKVQKQSKI